MIKPMITGGWEVGDIVELITGGWGSKVFAFTTAQPPVFFDYFFWYDPLKNAKPENRPFRLIYPCKET